MKKTLSFILVVSLVFALFAGAAFADDAKSLTVSLRIEGIEDNLYYADVTAEYEETLTLLALIEGIEDETLPEVVVEGEGADAYIVSIGGEAAATFESMDGWMYLVNGAAPSVAIGACELADGDEVVLYYSDEFATGMQFPVMDLSTTATDGVVVFTSEDTSYDADGKATVAVNPVAGMTVIWGDATYTTDDDGKITVEGAVADEAYAVSISRVEESGLPTVLRYAPDFTVTVPAASDDTDDAIFTDVAADAPYAEAVAFLFEEGIMNGVGNNRFAPDENLTRAMTVTIIWRAVGEPAAEAAADFTDVEDSWYTTAVAWASENGVVLGYGDGLFGTNDSVTLQQLATILARFTLQDTVDLDAGLAWATEFGLFADMGIEDYTVAATRAQVAQAAFNYLGIMGADAEADTPAETEAEVAA